MLSESYEIKMSPFQDLGVVNLLLKELTSRSKRASLTIRELKDFVDPDISWSLFLCGLAYLGEMDLIRISDNGNVERMEKRETEIQMDVETKLEDIVTRYKSVLKKPCYMI